MTCRDCAAEMTRLRAELAEARRQALTDALTRLPNRAAFTAHRNTLADVGHTVLLADVDGFKSVNDTYGHAAGDQVLQAIADRMRRAANDRRTFLARLAGDEFAATVIGDAVAGREVAHRLGLAVYGPVEVAGGARVWPSVSIGVAWHRVGANPSESLHAADQAMYASRADRVPAGLVRVDLPRNSRFPTPAGQAPARDFSWCRS